MGRTININLTDEERADLERGYRQGETHGFRQRCHMILLKADTRTSADVAAIVGVRANGQRLAVALQTGRHHRIGKPAGQGRRSILRVAEDAVAVRLAVTEHRQRIVQARAELEERVGTRFSDKTLRRFLKNLTVDIHGSAGVPRKRKPKTSTTST